MSSKLLIASALLALSAQLAHADDAALQRAETQIKKSMTDEARAFHAIAPDSRRASAGVHRDRAPRTPRSRRRISSTAAAEQGRATSRGRQGGCRRALPRWPRTTPRAAADDKFAPSEQAAASVASEFATADAAAAQAWPKREDPRRREGARRSAGGRRSAVRRRSRRGALEQRRRGRERREVEIRRARDGRGNAEQRLAGCDAAGVARRREGRERHGQGRSGRAHGARGSREARRDYAAASANLAKAYNAVAAAEQDAGAAKADKAARAAAQKAADADASRADAAEADAAASQAQAAHYANVAAQANASAKDYDCRGRAGILRRCGERRFRARVQAARCRRQSDR